MDNQQKIKLYKIRSFSQKLNATIEFIRQNYLVLGKTILLVISPVAVITGLLLSQYMRFIFNSISAEDVQSITDPFSFIFNPSYVGFIILALVSGLLNISIIINYLRIYNKRNPDEITVTEILNESWRGILPLFGLTILSVILIVVGFIAFIIPGIYLMIVLSISATVLLFEGGGLFSAISRSFSLMKGKWWSTFGLMFVTYFIMQAVGMIFIIPFYVFYFMGIFTMVEEVEFATDMTSWWFQAGMIISIIIMMLGSFLTQAIPIIAASFQYFNLVERQESVGLMTEIEQLDA